MKTHSKAVKIIIIFVAIVSISISVVKLAKLKKVSNKIENEKEATVEIQFDKEDFSFDTNSETIEPENNNNNLLNEKEDLPIVQNELDFDEDIDNNEIGTPQVEIKKEDVKVLDEGVVETYVHFGNNETAKIPY